MPFRCLYNPKAVTRRILTHQSKDPLVRLKNITLAFLATRRTSHPALAGKQMSDIIV
jgi:hypothetical protein